MGNLDTLKEKIRDLEELNSELIKEGRQMSGRIAELSFKLRAESKARDRAERVAERFRSEKYEALRDLRKLLQKE